MKQLKRSAVAVLSAAVLGGAGLAITAAPAHAAQESAVPMSVPSLSVPSVATEDVTWLDFKYSSWSHWTRDSKDSSHTGTLNAGSNYVYCWAEGETYTDKGHTSGNWLLTDDDSGNAKVWVSRVYLADSSYNAALRHC